MKEQGILHTCTFAYSVKSLVDNFYPLIFVPVGFSFKNASIRGSIQFPRDPIKPHAKKQLTTKFHCLNKYIYTNTSKAINHCS